MATHRLGQQKVSLPHGLKPLVSVSHALGTGTVGQPLKAGTELGTAVGQADKFPFARDLDHLDRRCPEYVEPERWRQCIKDAERFLATWGDKALALGWNSDELFGLHEPPVRPHPSYHRLSRYDATGLLWLLQGCRVTALSSGTAAIEGRSGKTVSYRKPRKPTLGPLGDSLDDFIA